MPGGGFPITGPGTSGADTGRGETVKTMPLWIVCLAAAGAVGGVRGESTWRWECPELAGAVGTVTVEPVKFGKAWAYGLEFDDGGSFAWDLAAPMLEKFRYTDAPPGVAGGHAKPFVASVAVYPFVIGGENNTLLTWEQIRGLRDKGWGVSNHSYWHTGNHWEPKEFLDEAQMRRELFWSQAVLARFLSDGNEICRRFVYPSGDFHYGPFLAEYGLNTTPVALKGGNSLTAPPAGSRSKMFCAGCRRNPAGATGCSSRSFPTSRLRKLSN